MNTWHLNVPKIAHFYWGIDPIPYLRYVSVTSFMKHNPDWRVVLWTTKRDVANGWGSTGHRYSFQCEDFRDRLFNLPIEIRDIEFTPYGFSNTISEVHKSNLANYVALSTEGGAWVDMDIIFFDSIDTLRVNRPENRDIKTYVCIGGYGHSGGFYLASAGNEYFARLLSLCKEEYDPGVYQSMGPNLCNKYFPKLEDVSAITSVVNIGMEAVYAHDFRQVANMIDGSPPMFTEGSIGMHWYGGHLQWGRWLQETDGGLANLGTNLIGNLLKELSAHRRA